MRLRNAQGSGKRHFHLNAENIDRNNFHGPEN
jgi:hypothetical protein